MSTIDIIILLISGCLGGFLAGLLGIGGGIVYVVLFSFYLEKLGFPQATLVPHIIANSLFAIFFGGLSGIIKQSRNKNFFLKPVLITAIPATLASIGITYFVNKGEWYSPTMFKVFFVCLLTLMAIKIFLFRKDEKIEKPEKTSTKKYFITGFSGGLIAALSGVGGGVIMVPFLTNFLQIKIRKATSISLGVIVVMAFFTSLYSFFAIPTRVEDIPFTFGLISLPIVIPAAMGSLFGSPLGVTAAGKIKPEYIRLLFIFFISLVIIRMVYKLW
ncbi:MAG: putative membrane protein YfcA [Sphingobacteriales bacterium]|jgi:uncharacterized membrane protein YfcA